MLEVSSPTSVISCRDKTNCTGFMKRQDNNKCMHNGFPGSIDTIEATKSNISYQYNIGQAL